MSPAATLAAVALAAAAAAQAADVAPRPTPAAAAARLLEAALDGRAHALLADLLAVAPKRLSGSEGAEAAVAWAERTMHEVGLTAVRRQPVAVPHWRRGAVAHCSVPGAAAAGRLDVVALGGSVATPAGGIRGRVLMVRSFEELAAKAAAAAGRIVFFDRAMPRALRNTFVAYAGAVPQRTSGASAAARAGAVAVLVRSLTTALDDSPHTGAVRYEADAPRIPAAALSTRSAERLAALLAADPDLELGLELDCADLGEAPGANVIGEIPGATAADEVVVLGGHLDAWDVGDGAHDDGAGCVHCLEAVRLLLACGMKPHRTIRVVLFTNEENGLRGAATYAGAAAADPDHRHVAAVESDRGGFEPKGFTTSLDADARHRLAEHLGAWNELTGAGALLPGGGGADVSLLGKQGVPLFGLVVADHRYFDYHHSDRDTIDTVNERELALGAAALAVLADVLADPARFPSR